MASILKKEREILEPRNTRTKIKGLIDRLQIGLTAGQTHQKKGFVHWKIVQQENNQTEIKENRLNTNIEGLRREDGRKGERQRKGGIRDTVKRINIRGI